MAKKPINTIPPMTLSECKSLNLKGLDFVLISGDAFVDHHSFCTAVIARTLQKHGYSCGVIAQPDWHDTKDFTRLGRPRLAYLVTAGNIDSMVNHYTASKKRRSTDAYSEGGKAGLRPDRATIVYSNRCKQAYPNVPVIIGGIEASLRRFAHYDYWQDAVRHSIVIDAGAELLIYGMGERPIIELANALEAGIPIRELRRIRGTCFHCSDEEELKDCELLPSYNEVKSDRLAYAKAFMQQFREQDAVRGKRLAQPHEKGFVIVNPPQPALTTAELDASYELPYSGRPHPLYKQPIPALEEVEFSITSTRGCYGGCNFCALTFHQGRVIQARSHESILREARELTHKPNFKGYIHDVGGPTANFREPACQKQLKSGVCADRQCIGYRPCKNLRVSHSDYVALLRKLRGIKGVKKVFVRSGIRYDYVLYDKDESFLRELVKYHVSGQLKIAPEHISEHTLYYMNKPSHELYEEFLRRYREMNKRLGLEQYVVPYLISSHPGCELGDAVELALYLKRSGHRPLQVQDFYPTPGTVSTCMYYTETDPRTGEPMYIPKTYEDKQMQRALMQYFMPKNFPRIRRALKMCGREELIGYGRDCLVPPPYDERNKANRK